MPKLTVVLISALVAIAALVLGAHFWRSGDFALAAASIALVALLFVPRAWAARALQAALALGAVEWLRTLAALVATRRSMGEPYVRLALILGAVAVATALGAMLLETRAMRARYRRER